MKKIAVCVYLTAGIGSAFVCLQSIMWAVWGAPTHWTQLVGLVSSVTLAVGAIVILICPGRRQFVCAFGVIGMGAFYVPAVRSLIPTQSLMVSPIAYLLEAGYVALAGSVLFFPRRIPGAFLGFAFILAGMLGVAAVTTEQRYSSGEFDRPAIICFRARVSSRRLILPAQFEALFSPSIRAELQKKGLGEIKWTGSVNDQALKSKLIVICTSKVASPIHLRYPKNGTIIYLWDGAELSSMPSEVERYTSFVTLQPDGMISTQDADGGISGFSVYSW